MQAVFWLPGYLEKTQGNLYEHLEMKTDVRVRSFNKKDSVDEKTDDGDDTKNDDDSVGCDNKKDN